MRPSAGRGLSMIGSIDPGAQAFYGNIKGFADGTAAAAGNVGEYVTAQNLTNTPLTALTAAVVNSLVNLPAGDWDVWAKALWATSGTIGNCEMEIWTGSTISGTPAQYILTSAPIANGSFTIPGPELRISLAAPTTINLVVRASVAMAITNSNMYARRRR